VVVLKAWDDWMETRPTWDQELGPWSLMKRARRILGGRHDHQEFGGDFWFGH